MNYIERFQLLMADWATKVLEPYVVKLKNKEKYEIPERDIFEIIFKGHFEITETFESLRFAEKLLSSPYPRSKKIAKEKYINLIISAYLQDIYILKERLNSYATKIKRMHERAGRGDLVKENIDPLYAVIKDALEKIVEIRGAHVHAYRYSDENIDAANTMALIANHHETYSEHYNLSLMQLKRAWIKSASDINNKIEELLNVYFCYMYNVVAKDGDVFMPTNTGPKIGR